MEAKDARLASALATARAMDAGTRNVARIHPNDIRRMWVNQPSTAQPLHALHGVNVLAHREPNSEMWRIYFLSGDVVSQQCNPLALSPGWPS